MQSKQPRKQAKKGEGSTAVASKDWRKTYQNCGDTQDLEGGFLWIDENVL